MTVQFGAVRILMQSQALAPLDAYEKQVEAIRKRIRGNVEVFGYDREVVEAVERELGAPQFDGRQLWDQAETKFKQYADTLASQNRENPDYRALLFTLGNVHNPLNPSERAFQKILIDGEDVSRFQREVFDEAFFTTSRFTNGAWQKTVVPVHNSQETAGKNMENAFRSVLSNYSKRVLDEVKQGQTANVLDLDA